MHKPHRRIIGTKIGLAAYGSEGHLVASDVATDRLHAANMRPKPRMG